MTASAAAPVHAPLSAPLTATVSATAPSPVDVVRAAAAFAPRPAGLEGAVGGGTLAAVERYDALFVDARVRAACGDGFGFDASPPRSARRRSRQAPPAPKATTTTTTTPTTDLPYDARIVATGRVPSRPGVLHDLFNASAWASFPRAKRALHTVQHALVTAREGAGGRGARTPAEDRIAMLDEGGVVVLATTERAAELARAADAGDGASLDAALASGEAEAWVFGHALLEALGRGASEVRAAVVVVEALAPHRGRDTLDALDAADAAVAHALLTRRGDGLPRHGTPLAAQRLVRAGRADRAGPAQRSTR